MKRFLFTLLLAALSFSSCMSMRCKKGLLCGFDDIYILTESLYKEALGNSEFIGCFDKKFSQVKDIKDAVSMRSIVALSLAVRNASMIAFEKRESDAFHSLVERHDKLKDIISEKSDHTWLAEYTFEKLNSLKFCIIMGLEDPIDFILDDDSSFWALEDKIDERRLSEIIAMSLAYDIGLDYTLKIFYSFPDKLSKKDSEFIKKIIEMSEDSRSKFLIFLNKISLAMVNTEINSIFLFRVLEGVFPNFFSWPEIERQKLAKNGLNSI